MTGLTHFDDSGACRMVNVGSKELTTRLARAEPMARMQPARLVLIRDPKLAKGDVLEVARLAGIMATTRADELIPLCHSLGLDGAEVDFEVVGEGRIRIESCVTVTGRTGVEMGALTAVSIAAFTIYDMWKSVDRSLEVTSIRLLEKRGGKSGHYVRENSQQTAVPSNGSAGSPSR